jgi:TPR repeat protein
VGEGVKVDMKQALAFFAKGCDLDERMACTELAIMCYEGKAVAKDAPRAITLFEKACKLGSQVSCKNLEVLKKGPR